MTESYEEVSKQKLNELKEDVKTTKIEHKKLNIST